MPPRPLLKKLPAKPSVKSSPKSLKKPSESENPSNLENENAPKSDPSASIKLEIGNRGRETFDLNEPWCKSAEEADEIEGIAEFKEEIAIDDGKKANEVEMNEGEEIEEDPKPINEKKKQKEYEVFVGGLDRDAVEEDLEDVFKKVGEVVEVRLVKNKHSQKNKGFAFVRFATVDQAKNAASKLNFTRIRGKICEVTRNNDNETLHLGNICTTWTKDKLVEKLKAFELVNLEDVHLIDDPNDKRKNRGYAFLNFSTHMDAVAACNKLQKGDVFFGTPVKADVAFAKSAVEPDEEIMAQVKSVFLDALPPSWDEEQVQEQFKKYGEIENVQLARNMPSAKRKDFGFISFKTREAALACIDAVNKDGIGEGAQKVLLRATLRKPLQKRIVSTVGGWRGYSGTSHDSWDTRSRGIGRSYPTRPSRTFESLGRGRGRDRDRSFGGFNRYSTRGDEFETEMSPVEKYDSQFRRRSVRQVPTPAIAPSRSRDQYFESSSSSRRSVEGYRDFPTSYSRVPSHGHYDDDGYDPRHDYYENSPTDAYDLPTSSRLKRPYSTVDDDLLESRSLARRTRSRGSGLDIDAYPEEVDAYPVRVASSYEEYSRSMPDDRSGYNSAGYSSRQLSGGGAPRYYYY